MTKNRAERITEGKIVPIPGNGLCTFAIFRHGVEVLRASGKTTEKALEELVRINYRRESLRAFEEQAFLCAQCGAAGRPLQAHHLKPRSKGRKDVRENLAGVDPECHERLTNGGAAFTPHPKVIEAVRQNGGLEWLAEESRWHLSST